MRSPLLIIQSNLPCDHLFWSYSQTCHAITSFDDSQTCHAITSFDHTVKPAMRSPLLIIQSNLPCDHLFWSYSQTCHAITSFDHTVKPAMPSSLLIIVKPAMRSPLLIIQSNLPCDHLFWSYSQICHVITSFKLSRVFKGNLSYKEIVHGPKGIIIQVWLYIVCVLTHDHCDIAVEATSPHFKVCGWYHLGTSTRVNHNKHYTTNEVEFPEINQICEI